MRYQDGDAQWMRAGRGTLHEEMWWRDSEGKAELYQLWINSPSGKKFAAPEVRHLLAKDTPEVLCGGPDCRVKILCGSVSLADEQEEHVGPLNDMADTQVCVCQLDLAPEQTLFVSAALGATFILYIRRGSVVANNARVRMGDMIYYESPSETAKGQGCAEIKAGSTGLSALLLLGEPIREPVVMGGPLVMANEQQYQLAASYFNKIGGDAYWGHEMQEEQWLAHTRKLDLQRVIEDFLEGSDANV